MTEAARKFAKLQKMSTKLPVELWDERGGSSPPLSSGR